MKRKVVLVYFSCVLLIASILFLQNVYAGLGSLLLEKEQHWETYGFGSACIGGGNNLFLMDVNGDSRDEILVGGSVSKYLGEERIRPEIPLTIWSWDGENMEREDDFEWNASVGSYISCVYAADADGDGDVEILTGQLVVNGSTYFTRLSVWSWDGTNLTFETGTGATDLTGVSVRSIFVSDLDDDGLSEIIICGRKADDIKNSALLQIWHVGAEGLVLQKSVKWCASKDSSANTVYACDLNGDGVVEVVTGGYDNDLSNSSGQLRVWNWNGQELLLKANREWRTVEGGYGETIAGGVMGNTLVNNLKVRDVDDDGTAEIVAGGFAYDGENVTAQVSVWSFDGDLLSLEGSKEWVSADITEVKGVSLDDVDGDGKVDIVGAGIIGVYGSFFDQNASPEKAELTVWSWDGERFMQKIGYNWYIDEGASAQNLATGDVDNDGVNEILTVGCSNIGALCDPDMRIWSIESVSSSSFNYFDAIIIGGSVAVIVIVVTFLLVRKFRKS